MKKNRMMRLASILLVCVLLTTSVISGTFAKYVTSSNSTDTARVAKWGFDDTATLNLTGLFAATYDGETGVAGVAIDGTDNIIAPGTTNTVAFKFTFAGEAGDNIAPEVDYMFVVEAVANSTIDAAIENNTNIQWALDGTYYKTDGASTSWDKMLAAIEALDGMDGAAGTKYEAGNLPEKFYGTTPDGDKEHTVSWRWLIDDGSATKDAEDNAQNVEDTAMGNDVDLDKVTVSISITATQVD